MADTAYPVEGKTITTLQADLNAGRVTSAALVEAYLDRIRRLDAAGPSLRAVLATDPDAVAAARASDQRRRDGQAPRPLEGIPVLIKDNIETAGTLPTTAGSLALAGNASGVDATVVRRLREAGAIVLGKTNLSEWANYRSSSSISGWSGVGGLTRNPYALDRTACGSSSGSAAAVAASLAAAAIGTETDGSITCPASMTGIVGLKPTVGLVSRDRVVPISASQDTPGPMTRDVADASLLLSVIAGSDPADPATAQADRHLVGAIGTARSDALRGARIGVLRLPGPDSRALRAPFEAALAKLAQAGAVLVELDHLPDLDRIGADEAVVLKTEFKVGLDAYLARAPKAVEARSLAAVIAFNQAHADRELALFGQDLAVAAEATSGLDDPAYLAARAEAKRLAGADGLERLLREHQLDAMVAPTAGPAWLVDPLLGDHGGADASTLPAVAGLPHLTVPMGAVDGLPVGLSFIGAAWSEPALLRLGAEFERVAGRAAPPAMPVAAATPSSFDALLAPYAR